MDRASHKNTRLFRGCGNSASTVGRHALFLFLLGAFFARDFDG